MSVAPENIVAEKTKRSRILYFTIPLLLFVVLVGFFIRGMQLNPQELPSEVIGRVIPAFALPTLDDANARITPEQLQGKPYLLNVWATWCPTCYVEHPYLLQLQQQGVRIIGVNYKDEIDKAKSYISRLGNPYEVILVDEGRLGIDLGVYGAPETFLISADGKILLRRAGDMNERVWQEEFLPLLQKATVQGATK